MTKGRVNGRVKKAGVVLVLAWAHGPFLFFNRGICMRVEGAVCAVVRDWFIVVVRRLCLAHEARGRRLDGCDGRSCCGCSGSSVLTTDGRAGK